MNKAAALNWRMVNRDGIWLVRPDSLDKRDTIVVFFDYQCPFCRTLRSDLKNLSTKQKLPPVRLRQFPLSIHPLAHQAALIAICADLQGEFEAVDRYLVERTSWQSMDSDDLVDAVPIHDRQMLTKCISSGAAASILAADSISGALIQLIGTPGVVTRSAARVGTHGIELIK
jgi:protein-disulfide isomerase